MGKIASFLGFSAPKAKAAPVAVQAEKDSVDDQSKAAKATRAALYGTEGGAVGDELDAGQVKRRPTLLGN